MVNGRIYAEDLCAIVRPGDGALSANPNGLGKAINFFQKISQGDDSKYGHVFFFKDCQTYVESNVRIHEGSINDYVGKEICLFRHRAMNIEKFKLGWPEVEDNLGQIYPAHRLLLIGLDSVRGWLYRKLFGKKPIFRWGAIHTDWPVCSEYYAQFLVNCGLETGLCQGEKKWAGVMPDDFDDARQKREDLYKTIFEGTVLA